MRTGHEKDEDKRGKQRPRWDRRVTRSLGDGVHVVPTGANGRRMVTHVSRNSEHHVRLVAQLRRERMLRLYVV